MTEQLLIADCVIACATEIEPRRRRVILPFLAVEFATEVEEHFVYATMEVAAE